MKHRTVTTVTLLCDRLHERIVEWRRTKVNGRKGTFASFRDRPKGARFVQLFPQFAGKVITFTYGKDFALPAEVADWLFANGYLQPKRATPLWT